MEPHRNHIKCKEALHRTAAFGNAAPLGTTWNHTGTTSFLGALPKQSDNPPYFKHDRNHVEPHRNHMKCKEALYGIATFSNAAPVGTTWNHTGTTSFLGALPKPNDNFLQFQHSRNHMEPHRNHIKCKEALRGMHVHVAARPPIYIIKKRPGRGQWTSSPPSPPQFHDSKF